LIRSKIEGGKLKLELHAFFSFFQGVATRHEGSLDNEKDSSLSPVGK